MQTTSQVLSQSTNGVTVPSDMSVLKRELSLDLGKSKMSVDDLSVTSLMKHNVNISSASNTPNCTHTSGSTSQSMTPSEFGYLRQSNAVSTDNSPKSDIYESIEQAFKNYDHCTTSAATPLLTVAAAHVAAIPKSPIKSTINITYKSPARTPTKSSTAPDSFLFPSDSDMSRDSSQFSDYEPINVTANDDTSANSLLETSFDDTVVYEKLKFFKGAISEVNHLLDNGNEADDPNAKSQIVPNICEMRKKQPEVHTDLDDDDTVALLAAPTTNAMTPTPDTTIDDDKSDSGDVLMPDQELHENADSLEFDSNVSMYENVNLRKPRSVYANIDLRHDTKKQETGDTGGSGKENNKPGNFTVRQLANKFETSPVDPVAPYDFSKPFNRKSCDTNRNAPPPLAIKLSTPTKTSSQTQQFDRSSAFTRSLDENAFVREFGGSTRLRENVNKSTQQIPLVANVLTENSPSRRLSMECTRPKSLNPPKRLPAIALDDRDELCKVDERTPTVEVKITPTTENPISLIQHNVNVTGDNKNAIGSDDERNVTANKVLGNFKLDRERIERIKEERRLQLNEKFRSESFKCEKEGNKAKSKSKIELTDLKESDKRLFDTLQYKSKSRNEIYNKRDAVVIGDAALPMAGEQQLRTRRISDEKNQNDCIDTTTTTTSTADEPNVVFKTRKFDRRSIDLKREQEHFSTAGTIPSRAILHPQ